MATLEPSLLGALLIVLACGWAARRILFRKPDVFACLLLGAAGAVLGLLAAQAVGVPVDGALGLAGAALGGSVALQALLVLIKRR